MTPSAPGTPDRAADAPPLFQAAAFTAPGRPRPLARRLAIHNRVVQRLRRFMEERTFNETPVPAGAGAAFLAALRERGFPAVWCEDQDPDAGRRLEAVGSGLTAAGLCDLLEELLKISAGHLGADLLGGHHVTRLDRMIHTFHPRLGQTQARDLLAARGAVLGADERLDAERAAILSRHFGHLPFFVLDEAGRPGAVGYYLPYAGGAMAGAVAGDGTGAFTLDVTRLLQYLMGLESRQDALIDPRERRAGPAGPVRAEGTA